MSSPVYLYYFDTSKAFDRLNYWVLFDKLLDRNMPTIIVRLLAFWYTSQKFIIRWGSSYSETFGASNGVRQGGVLSPHLFNVYMDGLSTMLNNVKIGCCINDVSFNHLMYADDTVLLAPSAKGLQRLISLCEQYATDCDIIFNVKKSKYMCISSKECSTINVPKVFLNGNCIELVSKYKYLGLMICNNIADDEAISSQIRSLYARGNVLIKHFNFCSDDVKSLLFKTFCSSLYCCHLWCKCSTESRRRIKVAHNRVFRVLMKLEHRVSMSHTFLLYNIMHSDVIIRNAMNGFVSRINASDNVLIFTIINSTYYIYSKMYQHWYSALNVINM